MTSPTTRAQRRACELTVLREQIDEARDLVGRERRTPGQMAPHTLVSQRALVAALEEYADALTALGWPVPYRLHAELELFRGLTRAPTLLAHSARESLPR